MKNYSEKGLIFNIQRFSIHDGPGIRTLIFMKGCNLKCIWCCNPESQSTKKEIMVSKDRCIGCGSCISVCPTGAVEDFKKRNSCILCEKCIQVCPTLAREVMGISISIEEIMEEILKDSNFYYRSGGGITVTGGEPLMQPKFVSNLLEKCKEYGINTAIETCGYAQWDIFKTILEYVDLILFDIKHMNSKKHKQYTGVGNEMILQNLSNLAKFEKKIVIRVPVIPGYNDSIKNMNEISSFAKRLKIKEIHLLPYHGLGENKYKRLKKNYRLEGIKSLSKDSIFTQKEVFLKNSFIVKIGG
jgi:pyruvate formate lyase activating enzyme